MSKYREKKHHGFRNFLIFCVIVAAVWYIGTFTVKTTEVTVKSEKIQNDVTVVQLTDLHGASFGDGNKDLIDQIKDAEPDIIITTGDMYTSGDEKGKETASALLSTLAEDYPVYLVNGEHDNDLEYEEKLSQAGVDVLDYETRKITVGKTTIMLYGITNVYYSDTFDLHNAFDNESDVFNLLAAHIANFKAFKEFGIDLALCGDSHGGQVRLPYVGGLINRRIWFPERKTGEEKYVKGLYELEQSKLFVSSGLGNYPVPVRFLNRPEVAVIHLQNAGTAEFY